LGAVIGIDGLVFGYTVLGAVPELHASAIAGYPLATPATDDFIVELIGGSSDGLDGRSKLCFVCRFSDGWDPRYSEAFPPRGSVTSSRIA
jgi:hypothetical protein